MNNLDGADHAQITVVGLGGAGGNIVARLSQYLPEQIKTLVIDTDRQNLDCSPVERKLLIGQSVTGGNSTGSNEEVGRRAAQSDSLLIREAISGSRFLFFIVGLGGGTGAGIAPMISRLAHSMQAISLTFATMPFDFEGSEKLAAANQSFKRLSDTETSIVLLPNQTLLNDASTEGLTTIQAFSLTDNTIATSILSMWRLMAWPGLINLDYGVIRDVLNRFGDHCSCVGVSAAVSEGVDILIERVLAHPLVSSESLSKAQGVIIGITASPNIPFQNVEAIVKRLKDYLPEKVFLRWGITLSEEMFDEVSVVMISSEILSESAMTNEPNAKTQKCPKTKSPVGESRQSEFNILLKGSGYFKNATPTIYNGENLDEPTYLRRKLRLPK